jgi:hypothetical protein
MNQAFDFKGFFHLWGAIPAVGPLQMLFEFRLCCLFMRARAPAVALQPRIQTFIHACGNVLEYGVGDKTKVRRKQHVGPISQRRIQRQRFHIKHIQRGETTMGESASNGWSRNAHECDGKLGTHGLHRFDPARQERSKPLA